MPPALIEHLQSAVGDRYLIEREIAHGGMATVYLATDRRHARRVALKVMDAAVSGSVGADRFLREITIAARLVHPHIVPLYDSGEARHAGSDDPALLYYVMPFIAGESLRDRLGRDGPLPVREVIRLVREVASALDYAHREGVVHRDIKPENLLISEGHVVVADFGIARAVLEAAASATLTQVGMIVGTPAYMSPEQAGSDAPVDGRSDQYSLACVTYEALTGRPPFTAASAVGLLAQQLTMAPPPLRTAEPVSDAVEEALFRALAKQPGDRFPSAGAFAEALATPGMEVPAGMTRLPIGAAPRRAPPVPTPLTPLVGREQEVRKVLALLQRESVRLLTLHGPGGIGKTRLALEVAARASGRFGDGVFFVPLTEVRDAEALHVRLAQVVGLRGDAVGSRDALREQLREQVALLVLDNFEQLTEAAPDVSLLLAHCPFVKVLVTSQRRLQVYGEHEFPVEPLLVPDAHQAGTSSEALASPAVQLFVERAVAAQPGFVFGDDNAAAVVEICARLDGVPLAIELAAARMRGMSPQALLPKLRLALDLLTGGARDLPPRQRTMRNAIAWCHDLLSDGERTLFRHLAVFAGGVTFTTATAVCRGDATAAGLDDMLASLVDHSLVRSHTDAGSETRYTMLLPIHAFACEALAAAGETADVATRHTTCFMELACDSEPYVARGVEEWIDRLEAEHHNVRAALDRLTNPAAAEQALRMAVSLWRYWDARSYAREGLDRLRAILELPAPHAPVKLRLGALYAAGVLADSCGEYALGRGLFEQHLALTQELGDPRAISVAQNNLAVLLLRQGDADAAIPLFEAVVAMLRDFDPRGAAVGIANIGDAEHLRRHFAAARDRYDEAIRIFTETGDETNIAWALSHLADVARDEGDREEAKKRYRESLALFAGLQHRRGMGAVLTDFGELTLSEGNGLAARTMLEEALVHAAETGDQRAMVRVFEVLAGVAAASGTAARALRIAGAVAGLRESLGAPLSAAERDHLERRVAPAMAELGEVERQRAWKEGLAMPMEEALRYVTSPEAV